MSESRFLFSIVTPASTANLGPGFDSIGLALNRFLVIDVFESNKWEIIYSDVEDYVLPSGKDNYLYKVASSIAERYRFTLPTLRLVVESEIPLARGLGSSASAVVAAIELVNELGKFNWSNEEKLDIAATFEGHVDNIGASLYGGCTVGIRIGEQNYIRSIPFDGCDIVSVVPPYEVPTEEARNVLPVMYSREAAVVTSGAANVLIVGLYEQNWELIGAMMNEDRIHQPYRSELVAEYQLLQNHKNQLGIYAVTISGAGPTLLLYVRKGDGQRVVDDVKKIVPHCRVEQLEVSKEGVSVVYHECNSKVK